MDLTGGGRRRCRSLGDGEGSGQDGGLQRGRPSRRALTWIHGGVLRPPASPSAPPPQRSDGSLTNGPQFFTLIDSLCWFVYAV